MKRPGVLADLRSAGPLVLAHRRAIVRFEVGWKLLSFLLLGPATVALFHASIALSGEPSITNTALARWALSPLGFATIVTYAVVTLTLHYLERAGAIVLLRSALAGAPVPAGRAIGLVLRRAAAFSGVALAQVGLVLAALVPFAAVLGVLWWALLSGADINYHLAEKPPEFVVAAAIGALVALLAAVAATAAVVRWLLAVPLVLFEGKGRLAALRESAVRLRGRVLRTLLLFLAWHALRLAVAALVLAALDAANEAIVPALGESLSGMALLLAAEGAVLAALSIVAGVIHALLVCVVYESCPGAVPVALPPAESRRGVFALAAGAVAVIVLVAEAASAVGAFAERKAAEITAHRAGALRAPENSLAALRLAAAEGAGWAEIDVQETRDGAVIVHHDSDFKRMAGSSLVVWEADLDAVRALDIGGGERVATLEEFIAEAKRARIGLNIELKTYGHGQKLAERVVGIVRAADFASLSVITSLDAMLLAEVRRIDRSLRIGLIVTARIGDVTRLDVDFLSVEKSKVVPALVAAAKSRGLAIHAWTVNRAEDMVPLLLRGADNLITDDPALAVAAVMEYDALGDVELVLARLRLWLRS